MNIINITCHLLFYLSVISRLEKKRKLVDDVKEGEFLATEINNRIQEFKKSFNYYNNNSISKDEEETFKKIGEVLYYIIEIISSGKCETRASEKTSSLLFGLSLLPIRLDKKILKYLTNLVIETEEKGFFTTTEDAEHLEKITELCDIPFTYQVELYVTTIKTLRLSNLHLRTNLKERKKELSEKFNHIDFNDVRNTLINPKFNDSEYEYETHLKIFELLRYL